MGKRLLFEEISDAYPDTEQTLRSEICWPLSCLREMMYLNGSVISAVARRGRVSLAKLMLSEANFLILDEPTNHLDITSKEILEECPLHSYDGHGALCIP